METVGNTKITPATWNGKYPLSDLPLDATWNGSYDGAYECLGFAKMVLDATYGRGTAISSWAFSDNTDVKSAFGIIAIGDRVTFATRNTSWGAQHAIIVAGKSSTGITIYDCNSDNQNTIKKYTASWQALYDKYTGILGGVHHKH